jgi:tetratricopeptide (TPR) repeat protein
MKNIICVCLILFGLHACAQTSVSSQQWREDLRFLQTKVHQDYSNLFHKITAEEFDKAVETLYAKIPSMQDHEIKVGFAELVAMFGYGHTALWLTGWHYNEVNDFRQMPYNLYWFKNGIYIQGVQKEYEKALGAKVIKIENTPIDAAIEAVKPVVSSENDQFFKGIGLNYLGVPEVLHAKKIVTDMSKVTMTLEKGGKQFQMTFKPFKSHGFPGAYGLVQTNGDWVAAHPPSNPPLWLKDLNKPHSFEFVKDKNTLYVRQSTVLNAEETLEQFYSRVFQFIENNDVECLVIDLRLNGGGDNHNNRSVILGLIKSEKINQNGKFYVVLGRRTFSAAQNFVNELENYTEAIFVGEPTAENVNFYGDANFETLPNSKLRVRLSWAWWQDKNPRDTRQWTAPHIPVELSFEDYAKNHDPILNAIFLSSDLEKQLSDPSIASEPVKFKNAILKYANNPAYNFFSFESKINSYGYELVKENKLQDAVSIFSLNAEMYPDSPNVWDSLAESYWRSGNTAKAKELYNKVIEMDPNGIYGENARNMLDRMN